MNKKNSILKKTWPRKNLGEIVNFLEKIHPEGLSLATLSQEMGITKQEISRKFVKDDMKLSKAEEIARVYGCALNLYFTERERLCDIYKPVKKMDFPNAGNLSGLIKFIYDSNYSVSYACRLADMNYNILLKALKCGDIQISYLYKLSNALGIEILWLFERQKDEK